VYCQSFQRYTEKQKPGPPISISDQPAAPRLVRQFGIPVSPKTQQPTAVGLPVDHLEALPGVAIAVGAVIHDRSL
jgi:hypothetical protein